MYRIDVELVTSCCCGPLCDQLGGRGGDIVFRGAENRII